MVEFDPARDQDGSALWQHAECSGVQPFRPRDEWTAAPDAGKPCPLCGVPGNWLPLYVPAVRS